MEKSSVLFMNWKLQCIAGFKGNCIVLIEECAKLGMRLYITMSNTLYEIKGMGCYIGNYNWLICLPIWVTIFEDGGEFRRCRDVWHICWSPSRMWLRTVRNGWFFRRNNWFLWWHRGGVGGCVPNAAHVTYLARVTDLKSMRILVDLKIIWFNCIDWDCAAGITYATEKSRGPGPILVHCRIMLLILDSSKQEIRGYALWGRFSIPKSRLSR